MGPGTRRSIEGALARRGTVKGLFVAFSFVAITQMAAVERATAGADAPLDAERMARRVADDALDGRLDDHSLLQAALWYDAAVDAARLDRAGAAYVRWCERTVAAAAQARTRREQARFLLHALHDRWCFGPFEAPCSRIEATLQEGRYNCVTTVILFHVLARRMGWTTETVAVPGHVFVRISGDRPLDIQTTCRGWLDEGIRQPPVPGGPQRVLSDVQLLAKLHYNAGVIALSQGRYAAAASSFRQALVWDPQDRSAAQNLVAAYNNGALHLCQSDRHAEAIATIERAVQIDPLLAMLRENEVYIYHHWLNHLAATGQRDAAEALTRYLQRHQREYLRNRQWHPRRPPAANAPAPGVASHARR